MHIQKKLLHLCIVTLMYTTSKAQPSITAVIGSIIDQKVDAIVNAANPHLSAGGGVCGAIFEAAGKSDLEAKCALFTWDQPDGLPVGDAIATDSCNLKSKGIQYIIHAIGPDGRIIKDQDEQRTLLQCAYLNSLQLAEQRGVKSIAFPFISSGIYNVDPELAAQAAVDAIKSYVKGHPTHIKEIRFALWGPTKETDFELFQNILAGKTKQKEQSKEDFNLDSKKESKEAPKKKSIETSSGVALWKKLLITVGVGATGYLVYKYRTKSKDQTGSQAAL